MHRLALATILMVLCGLGVREANSRPLGRRREGPPVVAPARDPDTAARVRYRFNGTGTYHQLGAAAPAGDIDRDGVMDLLLG
ncbi:MAG: hypothetical protein K0Q72_5088, partial [Armatimonadetes bacterium]|nr:hypothetical protein [Armatimonadota bacterium]